MKFTCEDMIHYLSDYVDNDLDDELTQAAREHLATCHNCRIVLDSTQKTIILYREQGAVTQLPKGRRNVLYERIAAAYGQRNDSSG